MRVLPEPGSESLELATVLHALGDPVRLELVRRAWANPDLTCSADGIEVPKSTLSSHWRILRESGVITMNRNGRTRHIRLRGADLESRFPGLLPTVLRLATRCQSAPAVGTPQ